MERHKFELATQWKKRFKISEAPDIWRSSLCFVWKTLLGTSIVALALLPVASRCVD
jgi:hypothetical protein